jgi:hypothetical protein
MNSKTFALTFAFALSSAGFSAASLQVDKSGTRLTVGNATISSPAEGLWSIATDWGVDWPVTWAHANPERIEQDGPWTLAYGIVKTTEGDWQVQDAYRPLGKVVKVLRRFEWKGPQTMTKATLSARWQVRHSGKPQAIMPSVLYNGNPSGAKTGFGLVPVYNSAPGEELIVEEHRYPMPFVSLEWNEGSTVLGAAVHSLPSLAPYAARADQWWSLGLTAHSGFSEIALLSGPCSINGRRSAIKANQAKLYPYNEAWVSVPPGGIIEKTFYLQAYPVETEGSGFEAALTASLEIFKPEVSASMPSLMEIIRDKYRLARSRWYSSGNVHGYTLFPHDHKRKSIGMGWVGQADVPGYALPVLEKYLDDPDIADRAQKSLDFLTTSPFGENGFAFDYNYETGAWTRPEFLAQGSAMNNFAKAIANSRKDPRFKTEKWQDFLQRASDFHAGRILRNDWRPVSTNEAFLIAPLLKAAELFQNKTYETAALKATDHYAGRHRSLDEPYWGGTLDARAEDKEGAWAAFQGFLAAYEHTRRIEYLKLAKHACDLMLTYTVVWDIAMPPGRMASHDFKTRGWTSVSVQNQHLDVFGVVTAPSVYRLGQYMENERYRDLAILMFRSCGQIIDPSGSQGEQVQQTNYLQHGRGKVHSLDSVRGGYLEDWTVFWITAHFLNAAAQFEEMGVTLE